MKIESHPPNDNDQKNENGSTMNEDATNGNTNIELLLANEGRESQPDTKLEPSINERCNEKVKTNTQEAWDLLVRNKITVAVALVVVFLFYTQVRISGVNAKSEELSTRYDSSKFILDRLNREVTNNEKFLTKIQDGLAVAEDQLKRLFPIKDLNYIKSVSVEGVPVGKNCSVVHVNSDHATTGNNKEVVVKSYLVNSVCHVHLFAKDEMNVNTQLITEFIPNGSSEVRLFCPRKTIYKFEYRCCSLGDGSMLLLSNFVYLDDRSSPLRA